MWYWSVHVCVWMTGMWDPSPPSGLAGGDIGDRLQDDVRRRGIQPQAPPTGRPGGSGLPHTFLPHRSVDTSSHFLLLFPSRWLLMFSAGSLLITLLNISSVACRFLFPGLPDDGGIIPEPPASNGRHDSNTAEQGWVSTHWADTTVRNMKFFCQLFRLISSLLLVSPAVCWWWAAPLCSSLCCSLGSTRLSSPCTACRRSRRRRSTGTASSDSTNSPTSLCSAFWECRSKC